MQVKYEINELKARKDEELEHIILRNRCFGRSDRDTEKRIDEIEKSRREKENELKKRKKLNLKTCLLQTMNLLICY